MVSISYSSYRLASENPPIPWGFRALFAISGDAQEALKPKKNDNIGYTFAFIPQYFCRFFKKQYAGKNDFT